MNMRTCGNFDLTSSEFLNRLQNPTPPGKVFIIQVSIQKWKKMCTLYQSLWWYMFSFFRICHFYILDLKTKKVAATGGSCSPDVDDYIGLSVLFGGLTVFFLCTTLLMYCRNQSQKGYTYLQGDWKYCHNCILQPFNSSSEKFRHTWKILLVGHQRQLIRALTFTHFAFGSSLISSLTKGIFCRITCDKCFVNTIKSTTSGYYNLRIA